MAKKRENKFLSFIVVVILIVFVGAIFIVIKSGDFNQNISNSQPTSSQVYKSKSLKFTLIVPLKYEIVDNLESLILNSKEGKISVLQNGTNYSNLTDYLNKFDERRNLVSSDVRKIFINGFKTVSRIVKFPEEKVKQKSYYIYVKNTVYIFSTRSEELFDDLDQIAQSFKYTP